MKARGISSSFHAWAVLLTAAAVSVPVFAQKPPPWDGNRSTPVHLIPLLDENNEPIIPTENNPLPLSVRFTCGVCHRYSFVKSGLHFNALTAKDPGRPGEPWIWHDPRTGSILPVSYRKWPGTWEPADLGLTPWDFTLLFGRHMPGGGAAEPEGSDFRPSPESRWSVSGKAEVNCLACHNKSGRQDHSEWAKQILRENFRWAATAAGGVGEVGGMASRLRGTWDIYDGPNLDDNQWAVAPFVKYRTADFDGKHRFFFDLDYQPQDARCLACHSVSPAGALRHMTDVDVHTAAGLRCADCHRNGLDHNMIRGYEGEAEERTDRTVESFTCRGCHLGEDAEGKRRIIPGRLGAPFPKHGGIPLAHFKRLNCTVCHSGFRPDGGLTRVRTSRANRLGIHGAAQWWTGTPNIVETVYVRDGQRKLTPSRLVWPAFWVKIDGKNLSPLKPGIVEAAAGELLDAEIRITRVLAALRLGCEEGEVAVLAAGDKIFTVSSEGVLNFSDRGGNQKDETDALWGIRVAGEVVPLIPDFDPAAEDKDPDIEPRIETFLSVLGTVADAPGEPVFVTKKTLYQIKDGYFDVSEAAAEVGETEGWGWLEAGTLVPLVSEFDIRTAGAKAGHEETLTEEQVVLILEALSASAGGPAPEPDSGDVSGEAESPQNLQYGYIEGGRLFRVDGKGKLTSIKHPAADPVTWPLAHDVRPAQQSLGSNGCTDCHSSGSDFFFTEIEGAGPLLTEQDETLPAASFMKLGGLFQRLFGLSFVIRPLFKIILTVCIVVVGSLLALAFIVILGRLSGLVEKGGRP